MSRDRHEWFLNRVFRYRPVLQRYLRKRLPSEDDVEDVIQETYLRVYTVRDYESVESPKAMLITIAHNLSIQQARRRNIQATEPVAEFDEADVSSDRDVLDDELDALQRFEAFCAAVDSLPPICRRAFVLRKVYQLLQSEISTVLGVSENTIEKHVAKGLTRCRDYFREHGLINEAGSFVGAEKRWLIRDGETSNE